MEPFKLLTVAGSLRRDSHNRALLCAAEQCAPPGVVVDHADIRGVPAFDEDREPVDAGGAAVASLRSAVAAADAVLLATPEYNQSLPGVLKNAVDWLSRPAPDRVLAGKPVGVVGVTSGPWGTRYAQQTLRHVLGATGCLVMASPMLFVRHAGEMFEGATLVDEDTRGQLAEVVAALVAWSRAVGPERAHAGPAQAG